jgi:alkanesulfonate monooxygenase SsuD/methylene tetrahydromethanopterin reductase-like flavin-dependent oxidoreductase (luciferase family)
MGVNPIGVVVSARSPSEAVERIRRLEQLGVSAAWLTSGGGGGDSITLLAAAAAVTDTVLLGTSIVQTWARHPVALVQQVQVVADLAPGRLRLGIGTGHREPMTRTYGADFKAPLGHLKEYLRIATTLLKQGAVEFEGRWFSANASIPSPLDVTVMASALRPGAFEMCGAETDGAISWVCPHIYLRETAMPALQRGARSAGRPTPPMLVHAAVCVSENLEGARDGVRQRLGYFPATPFYASMFAEAGFQGTPESGWTNEMLDTVLISGDEDTVAEGIEAIFDWGASEILASVVPAGDDPEASEERTLRLLASLASS